MKHATERDWIAATRGNGTADRDIFEKWALGLRGAPSQRDPRVWEYLITMAEEMEAVERGAYGQAHDDLAEHVAHGVVARFQEESAYEPNARRRRPSSAPAFRSMLRPNRRPPPPPSALRSARERDRARYGEDEEIPVRPFDPEERVPFGTKPHHFAYPNGGRMRSLMPYPGDVVILNIEGPPAVKVTSVNQEGGYGQGRNMVTGQEMMFSLHWVTEVIPPGTGLRDSAGKVAYPDTSRATRNPAPPPALPPARRMLPPKR